MSDFIPALCLFVVLASWGFLILWSAIQHFRPYPSPDISYPPKQLFASNSLNRGRIFPLTVKQLNSTQ